MSGNLSLIKRDSDGYVTVEPMTDVPTGMYGPEQSITISYTSTGEIDYSKFPNEEDKITIKSKELADQCLFLNPQELQTEAKKTLANPNYDSPVVREFGIKKLQTIIFKECTDVIKANFPTSTIEHVGCNRDKGELRITMSENDMPIEGNQDFNEKLNTINRIAQKFFEDLPQFSSSYGKQLRIKFRFKPERTVEEKANPPCNGCEHINVVVNEDFMFYYPSKHHKIFKDKNNVPKTTEFKKKPKKGTLNYPDTSEAVTLDGQSKVGTAQEAFRKNIYKDEQDTINELVIGDWGPKVLEKHPIYYYDPRDGKYVRKTQVIQEYFPSGEEIVKAAKENLTFESAQELLQYYYSMIEGLEFCRKQTVGIGDLKPSNTVFKKVNGKIRTLFIDAFYCFKGIIPTKKKVEELKKSSRYRTTGTIASPQYKDNQYTILDDVWAAGISMLRFVLRESYKDHPEYLTNPDKKINPFAPIYEFYEIIDKDGKPGFFPQTKHETKLKDEDIGEVYARAEADTAKTKDLAYELNQFLIEISKCGVQRKTEHRSTPKKWANQFKEKIKNYPTLAKMNI